MRFFEASVYTLVLRFNLLMAIVIVSFFSGLYFFALLSVPLLVGTLLGVSFKHKKGNALRSVAVSSNEVKSMKALKTAA